MNRESRKKLARMILDKSRIMSSQSNVKLNFFDGAFQIAGVGDFIDDIAADAKVIGYFEKMGFQKANEWMPENISEKPDCEGMTLFEPDENHHYFGITTPLSPPWDMQVMKIDKETAEKILVLGLP